MINLFETSPSGDWFAASEHYFSLNGKLYFIFWSMNTYASLEPATIERRLYFDKGGNQIKKLESVYKMNTKEKIEDPNYMDHEITFWFNIKDLPFKSSLKLK